jgi:hypothetical protein
MRITRPRRPAIGILIALVAFGACGGGSTILPAASSGAGSAAPSGAPASGPAAPSASLASTGTGTGAGARARARASTGTGTGTGAIPSDECSVVTKADVEAAFGGSTSAGRIDENGHCTFDVSGTIHAGPNVSVPGTVGVSFSDKYTVYDTARMLFGDTVTKVDGLGTEAWYGLTAVHAKIAGGELVVAGFWVGDFNRDTITRDTITLAKAILARL